MDSQAAAAQHTASTAWASADSVFTHLLEIIQFLWGKLFSINKPVSSFIWALSKVKNDSSIALALLEENLMKILEDAVSKSWSWSKGHVHRYLLYCQNKVTTLERRVYSHKSWHFPEVEGEAIESGTEEAKGLVRRFSASSILVVLCYGRRTENEYGHL